MTKNNDRRDAERLPEAEARRLLQRASELEAARGAELSIAELRDAAREAGITSGAFDQALAELRERDLQTSSGAVPVPARTRRMTRLWLAAIVVATLLSLFFIRLIAPAT